MAKTTKKPVEQLEELAPETALIIISDDLITKAVKAVQSQHRTELDEFKANYNGLVITGTDDKDGYEATKRGIAEAKRIRNDIERTRKSITDPAVRFQKDVKAKADAMAAEVVPIEEHLNKQKAQIDNAILEAKKAEATRRRKLLLDNGWKFDGTFYVCGVITMSPDQLEDLTEERLQKAVARGQEEIKRQEAEAARKAEQERLAKNEAERAAEAARKAQEEADRVAKENEELRRRLAEFEAKANSPQTAAPPQPVANIPTQEVKPHFGMGHNNPPEEIMPVDWEPSLDDEPETEAAGLFRHGFEACRAKVLAIFNDPTPRNRAAFISAIQSLEP